jgi:hypothetical protein
MMTAVDPQQPLANNNKKCKMDLISEIRDAWGWVGIDPQAIVGENDFGNLIIEDTDGKYWRICPEDVYCRIVANNRDELDKLSQDQDFLADWYMTALVDQAKESVGPLTDGRKYCLVIPGVLGGAYDSSNIKSVPLVELIRLSGDIGQQIRDLPDGAKIKLKVVD